jgi:predicted secreted hydrolase
MPTPCEPAVAAAPAEAPSSRSPNLGRRSLLLAPLAGLGPRPTRGQTEGPRFPHDHGAHPDARIEWWYLTGALALTAAARGNGVRPGWSAAAAWGFQLTFFRLRLDGHEANPSAFAPRQWLIAHAALADLGSRRLLHASRAGRAQFAGSGLAEAAIGDTALALRDWRLRRDAQGRYLAQAAAAEFAFDLRCAPTQAPLLQGPAGLSLKAPPPAAGSGEPLHASRYYSLPQLEVAGRLRHGGRAVDVIGRGWLDHEWSDALLHPQAQGWDWAGINLHDGAALTLFQLRRRDGGSAAPLWAGGSFRTADGRLRLFEPGELRWQAQAARWRSPVTQALYPTAWRLDTPVGRFELRALFDAQEIDSRASVGSAYWEGLAELLDGDGRRLGLGYLEMTGYAGRLRI